MRDMAKGKTERTNIRTRISILMENLNRCFGAFVDTLCPGGCVEYNRAFRMRPSLLASDHRWRLPQGDRRAKIQTDREPG